MFLQRELLLSGLMEARYGATDGCCALLCCVVLLCWREARHSATDGCYAVLCCCAVLCYRVGGRQGTVRLMGWCAVLCCAVVLEGGKVQCD
jgi:hypothetical protein